ncbi:MAG: hypothetical protein ASARMPREDX12_006588 [Alectoria sarmentosa]|nr:MAG: hypothetical protein ASARMPREDX12_006588 [Alectoria sarmentosa]
MTRRPSNRPFRPSPRVPSSQDGRTGIRRINNRKFEWEQRSSSDTKPPQNASFEPLILILSQVAPPAEQKATKQTQQDRENRRRGFRLLHDQEETKRLIADRSDKEVQEELARQSEIKCSSASEVLPGGDTSGPHDYQSRMCAKVMNFIRNARERTGADLEPRPALLMVLEAGGHEKVALEKLLKERVSSVYSTIAVGSSDEANRRQMKHWTSRKHKDLPPSDEGLPQKVSDQVEVVDEGRRGKGNKGIDKSGREEGGKKKRGVCSRLFRRNMTGEAESADIIAGLEYLGWL